MNIRDLRYFRALAQTGHVGKAAVQCHVSQPTLSMQIKKMEQELGVLLFERSRQAWRLSPAGMHALALAKESLTLIDALKSDMQAFKNPLAGQVALGLFPTLAPFWLPSLLPGLRRALPDIHWSMQEHVTEDCLSALHEGTLDVIVIAHQPDPSTGIVAQKLFSEDFVLACSRKHALAQRKAVHAKDIPDDELLLLEEGHCLREQSMLYCARIKRHPRQDLSATSLSTLMAMVALNEGITLLPSMAVPYFKKQGLAFLNITPKVARTLYVCWRQSMPRAALVARLHAVMAACR